MNEEIDVSKCAFYSKGKCNNPNGMACNCRNTAICYFKELKRLELENKKLKEKLDEIKELATPLRCNNPFDCWMNKDEGTGDIYGCEGDDYKGCPNGFASCILKIIEGAEDE